MILYECLAGKRPFDGTDAEVIAAVLAGRGCDPRARVPTMPARLAEVVVKATAQDPADRFASARELREALADCLEGVGGASKERDVTAALAVLLETPAAPRRRCRSRPRPPRSGPEPIGVAGPRRQRDGPSSDAEIALCEVEILDASGPIRKLAEPPPAPAPREACRSVAAPIAAGPPAAGVDLLRAGGAGGRRRCAAGGGRRRRDRPRSNAPRASAPSSCSIAGSSCAAAGRYGEALDAWEKALALAPDNRIYQANVQRLRGSSAGCAPRRPRSTSPARCASRARRWAPRRASVSTACSAWWRSTR